VGVEARMSGEMSTSVSNGFSNLMVMLYTCERVGCTEVVGVVEGDDGLFKMNGTPPTTEDFAVVGFHIKLDVYHELSEASFCGMVFDEEEKAIITEPFRAICNFGWASRQYLFASDAKLLELLRSSAMSMRAQYSRCPMLAELAEYGLRVTASVPKHRVIKTVSHMRTCEYEKDMLISGLAVESFGGIEIGPRTRMLFERRFGVPVSAQLAFEEFMRQKTDLSPINFPLLNELAPTEYKDMWSTYVVKEPHVYGEAPLPWITSETRRRQLLTVVAGCV
jgi:hypothetical protein